MPKSLNPHAAPGGEAARSSHDTHSHFPETPRRNLLVAGMATILGALVAAYKEFEQRVGNVSSSPGAKTDAVRHAVESMLGDFTARDIHDRCPHASIDLVRDVLGTMRKEGLVVALGKGRGAKWRRAAPSGGTP